MIVWESDFLLLFAHSSLYVQNSLVERTTGRGYARSTVISWSCKSFSLWRWQSPHSFLLIWTGPSSCSPFFWSMNSKALSFTSAKVQSNCNSVKICTLLSQTITIFHCIELQQNATVHMNCKCLSLYNKQLYLIRKVFINDSLTSIRLLERIVLSVVTTPHATKCMFL